MEQREAILAELEKGRSLVSICNDEGMVSTRSVYNWIEDDEDFASQVLRAREVGYQARADKAIEEAKKSTDAALGRLAFDAERWYLGKLSNAFSDDKARKLVHSGNIGIGTALDALPDA